MASRSDRPRVVLRNTFLDTASSEDPAARRRARSAPVRRRVATQEDDVQGNIAESQLLRLNALLACTEAWALQKRIGEQDTLGTALSREPLAHATGLPTATAATTAVEGPSSESASGPASAVGSSGGPSQGGPEASTSRLRPAPGRSGRDGASSRRGVLEVGGPMVSATTAARSRRPCKEKRQRIQRAMAVLEARITESPDVFFLGQFRLPVDLDKNDRARNRAMADLAMVASDAYRRLGGLEA